MPNTTTGSPSPAVTTDAAFFTCNPQQDHLFAVRPGVAIKDALHAASCFLASTLYAVRNTAAAHDDDLLHSAAFQLEAAMAIVDSVDMAVARARTEGSAQ